MAKKGPVERRERHDLAVTVRMRPSVKAMADKRAKEEQRSFANYLETLILADAERKK